jgi:hypothetical protein
MKIRAPTATDARQCGEAELRWIVWCRAAGTRALCGKLTDEIPPEQDDAYIRDRLCIVAVFTAEGRGVVGL